MTCLTFVDVMVLSSEDLREILTNPLFSEQSHIIRTASIWMRLRVAFIQMARDISVFKMLTGHTPIFKTKDDGIRFLLSLNNPDLKKTNRPVSNYENTKDIEKVENIKKELEKNSPHILKDIDDTLEAWTKKQNCVVKKAARETYNTSTKILQDKLEKMIKSKLRDMSVHVVNEAKNRITFIAALSSFFIILVASVLSNSIK